MEKQKVIDAIVIVYHKIVPQFIRIRIKPFLKRTILNENPKLYHAIKRDFQEGKLSAYEKECNYILKKGLHCIPYSFVEEYLNLPITCTFDEQENKYFVLHKGKRLYYPSGYTKERVIELYRQIGWEQDVRSPHYYWGKRVVPREGDVLVDVGAAEGIVVLENIEMIKRAILIECESRWVDALKTTFRPYKDKVEIVSAFCGATINEKTITIDSILGNEKNPIILKMDVEGAELDALVGATSVLDKQSTRLSVTTYHKKNAEGEITDFLKKIGNVCEMSDNYMLFIYEDCEYPYFRKGIIRSYKC